MGASASWNPMGLSRPVMGFLYLCLYFYFQVYLFLLFRIFEIISVNSSNAMPLLFVDGIPNLKHFNCEFEHHVSLHVVCSKQYTRGDKTFLFSGVISGCSLI
jgi:hypothetical protein